VVHLAPKIVQKLFRMGRFGEPLQYTITQMAEKGSSIMVEGVLGRLSLDVLLMPLLIHPWANVGFFITGTTKKCVQSL
jgi:hypothetical protein